MTNSPENNYKIKNITLTLYAFQLRENADEGYKKIAKNADDLWKNLHSLGKELNFPDLQDITKKLKLNQTLNEWENLLLDNKPNLKLSQTDKNYLTGSFCAEKAQDIYIAELTLFSQDKLTPILTNNLPDIFNPQGCLLQPNIKANFGQIILLYAEPVDFNDYRNLADNCVEVLTKDYIPQKLVFVNQGELLDSPIFEYQIPNLETINPSEICHILVWLKRNPNTLKQVTKEFDFYLKNLLLYQRKVLSAYYQGRSHYYQGQEKANSLEKKIPQFTEILQETDQETRLKKYRQLLKEILSESFEYRKCLRYLQECENTVNINITNFVYSLNNIKTVTLPEDKLELWESFLDLAQNKYQKQLEADIKYLIINQNLFQEMVGTIRANLEIEQIESDKDSQKQDADESRNLNITIGVVGGGMAVAGVIASSYTILKEPPTPLLIPNNGNRLYPFFESIILSVVIGLIPLLVWYFILLKTKLFDKRQNNQGNNKP